VGLYTVLPNRINVMLRMRCRTRDTHLQMRIPQQVTLPLRLSLQDKSSLTRLHVCTTERAVRVTATAQHSALTAECAMRHIDFTVQLYVQTYLQKYRILTPQR